MIVKNEEDNIERALSWAKPVAFEQIVVDTGSTDKTVELAQKAGAKVYHYKWINDFGAAKNYAIEKATGNWIAFLDADEYLVPEDAAMLIKRLQRIKDGPDMKNNTTILSMPWVHLDDNFEATSIDVQTRIFRNIKELRYVGRIHEQVSVYGKIKKIDDISIMHTGYAETEYKKKGKAERNIKLLRKELLSKSDDITIKAYLADSLQSKTIIDEFKNKDENAEVDALFAQVIKNDEGVPEFLIKKAYFHLIEKVSNDPGKQKECYELCEKAYKKFPDDLQFIYFYAYVLNEKSEFASAWKILTKPKIKPMIDADSSNGGLAQEQKTRDNITGQLLVAAQGLGDVENIKKYALILLKHDKTKNNILAPLIHTLIQSNAQGNEILRVLSDTYDINSPDDMLLIAGAAKDCGAAGFAEAIMQYAKGLRQ